ncbi:CapA family protein [Nonomuraea roseoviolacea]|uniref:Poly-gamma-glutamate synthesis protein (Capsule biosynthesis protein) n=1 Tax=Nonomuraea roseoviolacea subsp. carminata TaxID=160689 RepID=A0ABT1JYT3_9ACTN|nr:CapA family protein [Nonomuraea roseoviolacea]MCP2346865.1 poly-gamma-glutamate synthesis protein (capsule biosynthesis protein) [Nonomuraea roseoviolacea subsp. carminata]
MRLPRRAAAAVAVAAALTASAACAASEPDPQPTAQRKKALDKPAAADPTPTRERSPFTISFGGDVHFEGGLRPRLNNPGTALGPIASVLRKADLTMVNLETAITTGGTPAPGKQFTFRAPASAFTALKAAGVDVVSMANNHGMDYMESGLADSLAAIKKSKFPVVGIGANDTEAYRPFRRVVNGNRVSIIGATQVLDAEFVTSWTATPSKGGLASAKNEDRLLRAVRQARKNSDTVIVHLHWGTEMQKCPNPAQLSLAPKLVKAGADVVVGGHAHILLGAGYLDNSYISYGLGNFVFYNSNPATTGRTGVLTLTIDGRKVLKDQWTPATIQGGVPVPMTGSARTQAVADWRALRSCTGLSTKP